MSELEKRRRKMEAESRARQEKEREERRKKEELERRRNKENYERYRMQQMAVQKQREKKLANEKAGRESPALFNERRACLVQKR